MIWLLLIFFVPGGQNQDISTKADAEISGFTPKIVYPCDSTNISARVLIPTQGYPKEYHFLIILPPWGMDLEMTFDSIKSFRFKKRQYASPTVLNSTMISNKILYFNFDIETDDYEYKVFHCTIDVPDGSTTVPYVESILLNKKYELCEYPKTGYFDNFFPLNALKLDKEVHPCDGTNITAEIIIPTQGYPDKYNLLLNLPPWGMDLELTFDSLKGIELTELTTTICNITLESNSNIVYFNFDIETDDYKNKVFNFSIRVLEHSSTVPYVQSILLNKKHQLCKYSKTGYFDNFFPLNALKLDKEVHPCDGTNITAEIIIPTQGYPDKYNLLLNLPPWGMDLELTFDSLKGIELSELTTTICNITLESNSNIVYFNFDIETDDYKNKVFNFSIQVLEHSSTVPYVQSILLNKKHQLCKYSKTGYFDDFFLPHALKQDKVVHPCDGTRISAELLKPTEGYPKEYNLLIQLPTRARDLEVIFDPYSSVKLDKEGNFKVIINTKNTAEIESVNFVFDTENIDNEHEVWNFTIIVPIRPFIVPYHRPTYVKSIFLNKKHQLCKHPKTGYFDKFFIPKYALDMKSNALINKPVTPDVVPSMTSNKKEEIIDATETANNFPFTKKNITEEKHDNIEYTSISNAHAQPLAISLSTSETCGKKKIEHTALIVHGQSTKAGHWPWHVALFRIDRLSLQYMCGGTLLSKTLVLTAAHCVSSSGSILVPEAIKVYLGKHNLFFHGDAGVQEREVFQVIVHHKYKEFTMENDIALLKLKYEAVYTDFVQPACLWYKDAIYNLPNRVIFGTVVGWGYDHQEKLSHTLQQITIPIVPELTCLKSNPTFYHRQLTKNTFCAGFGNGSSVCNGDSGGGLMIFVTETPGGTASGAWYVRGIVSIALKQNDKNVCDPDQYTIFTDVEKYRDWVLGYLK